MKYCNDKMVNFRLLVDFFSFISYHTCVVISSGTFVLSFSIVVTLEPFSSKVQERGTFSFL